MSVLWGAPWGDVVHALHHGLLVVGVAVVAVLGAAPWYSARRDRLASEILESRGLARTTDQD